MSRSFNSAGALIAVLITSYVAVAAQGAAPAQGAASAQKKPLVPLATNTIAANPDEFYGEGITITAAVGAVLSKSAFSVDQKRVGQTMAKPKGPTDVLVIAPTLITSPDPDTYVTVIGDLMKFSPEQIAKQAKDYKLDLSPEMIAKYSGRPVLVATQVINEKFVDLAKKPLPPMTTDDVALSKVMKQVGPAFAALRAGIEAGNADTTAKNVAVLKQSFADTEAFWKTKAKPDAVQWAADARKQVDLIAAATVAAKWDDAKAPATTLGQSCASCHGAYRERLEDGTYRIKAAK